MRKNRKNLSVFWIDCFKKLTTNAYQLYNYRMVYEKIYLNKNSSKNSAGTEGAFLTTYILDNYENLDPARKRPFVVICPGGGYDHLSVREGEAVAVRMNALGFNAAVLTYTLTPMAFPAALTDLARAVEYVRKNASSLNTDGEKIFVLGFSAGGHLAASLGCYWNNQNILGSFIPEEIRPNGLVLCYPVITSDERFCHEGSVQNVLGSSKYTRDDVSLEKHITKDFPASFVWHTTEDESVPAENSLFLVLALRKAGVPFEYHLFRKGRHGLSLATEETSKPSGETIEPSCAEWVRLFANWANEI